MLSNKIKLGLICGSLFLISQNVLASYGCQDFPKFEDSYCSPDGSRYFYYGEVTKEMKQIKSTFRGKTYTYKDLIQPLNPDEIVEIKEFTNEIRGFKNELKSKLNNLTEKQFEQVLKIRGDYLENILDKKLYSSSIISNLVIIDNDIISLFEKFNVSQENRELFKKGSSEKHKTLKIMEEYIKMESF
ncbi:hypothetical protein [Lonepinella sp. BR2271]|uniref:hypothetical protein n=1 Tax=Lonepinella sp. BR2271 TaxID=3434550 RepID=UPI003F6E0CFA